MVQFIIHHSNEGYIYLSQFYNTNMQTRKLEALMEIIIAHLKSDDEREGSLFMAESSRYSTYVIESQEYSTSSLKSLQEEFEGIRIIYYCYGGIIITIGLHDYDSIYVAKNFIENWVLLLRRLYKTNSLTNIYERIEEVLVHLDKLLPSGNLTLMNQSYLDYLKTEAGNLLKAL